MSTIDLCRDFYMSEVAPMISRCFPDYEHRIAAGIAGEGSDCFGYDDEISKDHDWGIGVCLWLTDEDYDRIGKNLGELYRDIVTRNLGNTCSQMDDVRLNARRGALRITDHYNGLLKLRLDIDTPLMTGTQWFFADENGLAAAVNGEVFRDDLGKFSRMRNMLLSYYPDKILKMKLVDALHGFAGAWQANYPRCMARQDYVAAHQCISIGIEKAMKIIFLLERKYMPYYKWSYRAFSDLCRDPGKDDLKDIAELISRAAIIQVQKGSWEHYKYDSVSINEGDELVRTGEEVAALIAEMLRARGLSESRETFLEVQCEEIAGSIE